MSATYFETVQRQVRESDRRIKRAETIRSAGRRVPPGIGLAIGAVASLALWLVIGKVVLSLIG